MKNVCWNRGSLVIGSWELAVALGHSPPSVHLRTIWIAWAVSAALSFDYFRYEVFFCWKMLLLSWSKMTYRVVRFLTEIFYHFCFLSNLMKKMSNKKWWAVVAVVKWSAYSPSTIWVRIPLKSTVGKIVVAMNENIQEGARLPFLNPTPTLVANIRVTCAHGPSPQVSNLQSFNHKRMKEGLKGDSQTLIWQM